MNFGILIPITAIIATAWVIVAVLRYRQGEGAAKRAASLAEAEINARLAHENEGLRLMIKRQEERLAVLERIATDPATRTAHEIEQLR